MGAVVALLACLGAAIAGPALAAEADFGPREDKPQPFVVPPGVFYMTMTARGAGGEQGDSDTGRPGRGALVQGTVAVTPGEELLVYVARGTGWGYAEGGERGRVGGEASDGAGGGGASAVTEAASGSLFLVAGGGGGGGGGANSSEGGAGGDAGAPEARSGAPGMRGHDPVPEKVAGGCGGCEREGGGGKGDGVSSNPFSGGGGGGGGGGSQGGAGGEDGTINFENNTASGAGGGGGSSFIEGGALDRSFSIYTGCEEREGEDCEGFVSLSYGGEATRITAASGNGRKVRATQPYGPLSAKVTDAEGVPVNEAPVTFRVPGAGAGGVLPGGGATVVVHTNGQGIATLNGMVANATAGAWALEASIGGDSRPALFTLENEAIGTTAAVVSTLDPATALETPEFTATVAADVAESTDPPAGEVEFEIDGAPLAPTVPLGADGTARLPSARVPFLGAGAHTVTARYLGDPSHAPSTATLTETVTKEPIALGVEAAPNPTAVGEAADVTATVVTVPGLSRPPTGEVSFETDGPPAVKAPLSGEGTAVFRVSAGVAGSYRIIATYPGDEVFAAGSGEVIQTVGEAAVATVLSSTADPSVFGTAPTIDATLVRRGGGPAPTGTVSFSVDGQGVCGGPVAVIAAVAQCTLPADLAAGTHVVEAAYAPATGTGDQPSLGSLRQVVVPAPTSAAVAVTPVPSLAGEAASLRATVNRADGAPAAGSVGFVLDGVEIGPVPLLDGVAEIASPCEEAPAPLRCPLTPGAHLAEAVFVPADGNQRPSRAAAFAHVDDDPTTTTVTPSGQASAGEPVAFTAQVTTGSGRPPRGAVQFLVDGVALGEPVAVVRGVAGSPTAAAASGGHHVVGHFIGASTFADSEGAVDVTLPSPAPAPPAPPPAAHLELVSHKERVDSHGRLAPRLACVGTPGALCTGTVRLLSVVIAVPKRPSRGGDRVPSLPPGTAFAATDVAIPVGTTAPVALRLSAAAGRVISAGRTMVGAVDLATGAPGPDLHLRATVAPRLTPLSAEALGTGVSVRVRCARGPGAAPCRGDLRVFAGGLVGRVAVRVAAGKARTLAIPTPGRRGRRVIVQARTQLPVGHPTVASRRLTVSG
jgi:hypothetical protein